MGKRLSEAEIARYHRDGFLSPIDAFSPEEARGFRDRLEEFEQRDGRQFGKGHNFKPHLLFPWVDALVRHPVGPPDPAAKAALLRSVGCWID